MFCSSEFFVSLGRKMEDLTRIIFAPQRHFEFPRTLLKVSITNIGYPGFVPNVKFERVCVWCV